jgi:hypothetical protein
MRLGAITPAQTIRAKKHNSLVPAKVRPAASGEAKDEVNGEVRVKVKVKARQHIGHLPGHLSMPLLACLTPKIFRPLVQLQLRLIVRAL